MGETTIGNSQDRGVTYLFCGVGFAERMVVSLHSLRDHWQGPVTVFVTDDDCEVVIKKVVGQLDLDCRRVEGMKIRRHPAYVNKTLIPTWTPYKQTIFIDGDTLIVGTFDELFEPPLAITSFGDWQTQGRRMSGRINRWKGKSRMIDELISRQLAESLPAINTGVFAFHRGAAGLATWHEITKAGAGMHMTDEIAMQLLFSELDGTCHVVDDRFNCMVPDTQVRGNFSHAIRSVYDGQITEIITRAGRRLRLTPNHPVLTAKGFVAAGSLEQGNQLVANNGQIDLLASGRADGYQIYDRPAMVKDVFEAFLFGATNRPGALSSLVEVRRGRPHDFYGDGKAVQGNVEIVGSYGSLLNDPESCRFEECDHPCFGGMNLELTTKSRQSALAQCLLSVFLASAFLKCRLNQGSFLGRSHAIESKLRCFPSASQLYASLLKQSAKSHVCTSNFLGKRLEAFSSTIPFCEDAQIVNREFSCMPASGSLSPIAQRNTALLEESPQATVGTSGLAGKRLESLAGQVTIDPVIQISDLAFRGHVYDLSSANNLIIANDLYISNCSPIYGVHSDDVRIWHFHGGKHLRKEVGAAIWWPAFLRTREANIGGLADWAGTYDKHVKERLQDESQT